MIRTGGFGLGSRGAALGRAVGLAVLAAAAAVPAQEQAPASARERPPNIVFMLSDNLGFGEIGVYGGGVLRGNPTPRLDRLATEGTRFTNFNVEVECTPSRSALMTGRLPVRSGTGRFAGPGLPGGLPPWEITIGEMLSAAGYDTAIYGKWHLGDAPGRFPTDQGFDEWWGFPFSTDVSWYATAVGFDPSVAQVPHLLEGRRGEAVRQVEPYTLEKRPFIDATIAEKSAAYIAAHAAGERPFFLFVSWSLPHHPTLPHPEFKGTSGNGDFSDAIVEHDHRVGQVLDAIERAGIAGRTLVIYASDNGPDSADYPRMSFAGPFRGYLGSAYEGSIRTPMLIRWPGHVPAGRITNEIVAMVDFFPTLARLAGDAVPGDREMDGVDQGEFFAGRAEKSSRESVLVFSGNVLLAVKWRQFKLFFTGDSAEPRAADRQWRRLWAPLVYNVEQDPREEADISLRNTWIFGPAMRQVLPFVFSIDKEGLITPGGEKPGDGKLEIPFLSDEQLQVSMSAIKRKILMQRLGEFWKKGTDLFSRSADE